MVSLQPRMHSCMKIMGFFRFVMHKLSRDALQVSQILGMVGKEKPRYLALLLRPA